MERIVERSLGSPHFEDNLRRFRLGLITLSNWCLSFPKVHSDTLGAAGDIGGGELDA